MYNVLHTKVNVQRFVLSLNDLNEYSKKYCTVGIPTVPKSNSQIVKRKQNQYPLTHNYK